DTNRDNRLDLNEFRNLVSQNLTGGAQFGGSSGGGAQFGGSAGGGAQFGGSSGGGGSSYGYGGEIGGAGGYGSSSFQSNSYESSSGYGGDVSGQFGGQAAFGQGGYGQGSGNGYGISGDLSGGGIGSSSFDSSTFSSTGIGGLDTTGQSFGGAGGIGGATFGQTDYSQTGGTTSFESSSQNTSVQHYATDAKGLFQDPNPQIIKRQAPGGAITYKQNIMVRFLQPPAIPPPGPLIIKEVRPPQPPAPPPLVVRQRAPAPPQPPPLILRERPPQIPASVGSQTVIRKLPALPVPPRSVIIERLPAPPPKPRDIIIERWIPYGAMEKRKTIVQRATAAQQYKAPRNIIYIYENVQARVVRQFQRLGVTPENPQSYIQRYGAQLKDAQTLLQEARAAGVVEDISPPGVGAGGAFSQSSSSFGTEFSSGGARGGFSASGAEFGGQSGYAGLSGEFGGAGGAAGFGGAGGLSASTYEQSASSYGTQ
ncbi:unnamed protein product, partial [Didymodactylos carnosus]